MEDFDLRKYLAENKLLKEDVIDKVVALRKEYIPPTEKTLEDLMGEINADEELESAFEEFKYQDSVANKAISQGEYTANDIMTGMEDYLFRKQFSEKEFEKVKNAANVEDEGNSFQIETKFGVKQFDHYPNRTGDKVSLSTIGADDTRNTRFVSYDEAIKIIKDLTKGNLEEGIFSTIAMIVGGFVGVVFGFQFLKSVLKNIGVRIGKNVNLSEEKLKEMVNTLTKKENVGNKDINDIIEWRIKTLEKIDSGEIKTLQNILDSHPKLKD